MEAHVPVSYLLTTLRKTAVSHLEPHGQYAGTNYYKQKDKGFYQHKAEMTRKKLEDKIIRRTGEK